jgi:hypothetical protein
MKRAGITLARWKGRTIAQPFGWKIDGVIAPVAYGWFGMPYGLLCSPTGMIVTSRSLHGFWHMGLIAGLGGHPSIDPDDVLLFADTMDGKDARLHSINEIQSVTVFSRWFRNEIRLALRNGEVERYFIYARSATRQYRDLLRRTYPSLYREEGFTGRLAALRK